MDLSIDLHDDPDGTLLRAACDAKPKGLGWLFFPFFLMAIQRKEKQNMAHPQRWLENHRSDAGQAGS